MLFQKKLRHKKMLWPPLITFHNHSNSLLSLTWLSKLSIFPPLAHTRQVRSWGIQASHWIGGTPTEN